MTEDKGIFSKNKFFPLCSYYLMFFILLSTIASIYIGITNYKAHEVFFNKPLIAGFLLAIVTATLFFARIETRAYMALSHFFILMFGRQEFGLEMSVLHHSGQLWQFVVFCLVNR